MSRAKLERRKIRKSDRVYSAIEARHALSLPPEPPSPPPGQPALVRIVIKPLVKMEDYTDDSMDDSSNWPRGSDVGGGSEGGGSSEGDSEDESAALLPAAPPPVPSMGKGIYRRRVNSPLLNTLHDDCLRMIVEELTLDAFVLLRQAGLFVHHDGW
jgi:hypothetical protein